MVPTTTIIPTIYQPDPTVMAAFTSSMAEDAGNIIFFYAIRAAIVIIGIIVVGFLKRLFRRRW